ncbi:MAG: aldo/keto reductase [Victivallales bacterium]|nr:aldo/keto reductase [Victivallales bacterium]
MTMMKLRPLGTRSGFQVNPVSIGAMRFPTDVVEAVGLIRHAIDCGLVYIDTSRGYGESEFVLGRALKDGYRDKVILSSKCSPWVKKVQDGDDGSAASVRRRIEETLVRLEVDYLDFYQVWNINSPETWATATRRGGMVDGIRAAMAEGLVRHTGFTTHEDPQRLLGYLDRADWAEVILVSYNLLQRDYVAVLARAHELGIGTIVMNPCGGGCLAENSAVMMSLAREVGAASVAELALRYVYSNPDVDTMLCGMTRISDVDDSAAAVARGAFTPAQLETIERFFREHSREKVKFCTGCNYCMPCPAGINIPGIMGLIYKDRVLGLRRSAMAEYRHEWVIGRPADQCLKCGACEKKCTQHLGIMAEMAYAHRTYGVK